MKIKVNYLLLFALLFSPLPASSEALSAEAVLDMQQKVLITRVEKYLNNLTTFQASFEQVIPGQQVAHGMFYLQRPRKFLWQYNVPHAQKLISNGKHLYFYDEKSEQTTQLPLNSGMAALLTAKTLYLQSDDVMLRSLTEEAGFIKAELAVKGDDNTVSFVFRTEPKLGLIKLITADELGSEIHVGFSQIKEKAPLNQELFDFEPQEDIF